MAVSAANPTIDVTHGSRSPAKRPILLMFAASDMPGWWGSLRSPPPYESPPYALRMAAPKIEVFCRNLGPVWAVPAGLEHDGSNNGCTYWGSSVSWLNLVANHAMNLWL